MQSITSIRLRNGSPGALHLILDATAIYAGLWVIKQLTTGWMGEYESAMALTAIVGFLVLGHATGLYRVGISMTSNQEVIRVALTWMLNLAAMALLAFVTRYGDHFARSTIVCWAILVPVLICFTRMTWRIVEKVRLKRGIGVRRVAIAGMNELGLQVAHNINENASLGMKLTGFYDDRTEKRRSENTEDDIPFAGSINQLIADAQQHQFDIVFISLPMRAEKRIKEVLDKLRDSTASVYIIPDFFVFELMHAQWTNIDGIPAVSIFESPMYGVDGVSKRAGDLIISLGALAVAAIPMALIALAIKITSPGPVFFRQKRYGVDGREILVWKFRSMSTCDNGSVVKQATKGDARITPLGAILRKTSLDELPQLFNVIEGSMSLVGPRPHASAHNEQYRGLIRGYMLRHKIKPGITGLAQVEGCRGETDTLDKMQRRVDFDHRYIREWSLWLDIKILFKTLLVAWRQPEAY